MGQRGRIADDRPEWVEPMFHGNVLGPTFPDLVLHLDAVDHPVPPAAGQSQDAVAEGQCGDPVVLPVVVLPDSAVPDPAVAARAAAA